MPLRHRKHWFGVVLDAPDASELAHFYERLLGWRLYKDAPEWATLAPSDEAGYNVSFQQERNYVRPVWPSEAGAPLMMMHLDLEVDDLDEAVTHAVDAGAELAAYQPQDGVRVMIDPAGHPFCLYLDPDEVEATAPASSDVAG
jgi:catechol 2,3-dioxygenase-like lactoylglutathione lyase family enzyme